MTANVWAYSTADPPFITTRPGRGTLAFRRVGPKTAIAEAFASSPLRFLTPRNHGKAQWVFLANFGGGFVDGDHVDITVDAEPGTAAFLGTQASTKVYRSARGCSQRLTVRVAEGAAVAVVPDPIVCFSGARYRQRIDVSLAQTASVLIVDGYTSGRAARGERWAFDRFESRTEVTRGGKSVALDATRLDPAHGDIAERMGRFDAILTVIVVGERFGAVREAMLAPLAGPSSGDAAILAASPIGPDAAIVRVAATGFEAASRALRRSFAALACFLGDDPFARKW